MVTSSKFLRRALEFRLIPPFFKRHSSTIDMAIEKAETKATDIYDKVLEEAKRSLLML